MYKSIFCSWNIAGRSPAFSHLIATIVLQLFEHVTYKVNMHGFRHFFGMMIFIYKYFSSFVYWLKAKLASEFDGLQYVYSAVWKLAIPSNTACGLWMDCVSTAFVASVTFSFIILYERESIFLPEMLIRKTIRVNFKDFTVIAIAHRLHTIIDSDRVLVMDVVCKRIWYLT